VDTFRAEVAAAAIDAGAVLVNDVGGLADPTIAQLAARTGAGLVVMHTRAAPKEADFPGYDDPVADVRAFFEERMRTAVDAGVEPDQLVLDPGLDYAKTPEESIEVLRRLGELHALERPLLLAVSNKYFVGMLTGRPPDERLPGTLAALAHGVDQGAAIVRVHDVRAAADHLAVRAALRARGTPALAGDAADESLKWL
jgi:dihydropteroate synthase